MDKTDNKIYIPPPSVPKVPEYIPTIGEVHGEQPKQIHSTPPPTPKKN